MNKEIQDVLEELSSNRTLNTTYGGAAVLQAAIIIELRKLRKTIEDAYNWPPPPPKKRGRPAKPSPLAEEG